ncbi:glycosyltransferase [Roseivirga sp. E12]|uniref:glycosyltransferase n=1 Tax=Roseivirga sp. E12 TaxID=2819237 RepID=UPI001ABCC355|nr:glycosyltransferase [Roseivirga sp. E12]MBO3698114.1 glycosyltransferase [Roseivirga sp. E12]
MEPLVSIICISYNHGPYIQEALKSVLAQRYESIEIIVLDDGSSDNSQEEIKSTLGDNAIRFIAHESNIGYTKTFNEGLAYAKGDFIVDFALDDVMLPDFVKSGVDRFIQEPNKTGVVYSNADYIDESSQSIGNHKEPLLAKGLVTEFAQGDIFENVLRRYFICTPTMIIKKEVFDRLGGYDESLAYEDFDFWVRSSRYWHYAYIDEVHMQKRKLQTSMSANRYRHSQNEQLASALKVCQKAFHLCKTKAERKALIERLNYEYRQCLRNEAIELAESYQSLLKEVGGAIDIVSKAVRFLRGDFKR